MPKFTVRRLVDAAVIYETEIEAATENDALFLASDNEGKHDWREGSTVEYDARRFEVIDKQGAVVAEIGDW